MNRNFINLFLLTILFSVCENPVENKFPKIDTSRSTDMSTDERNKLIEAATHNDKYIVGSWELAAADSSQIPFQKSKLQQSY